MFLSVTVELLCEDLEWILKFQSHKKLGVVWFFVWGFFGFYPGQALGSYKLLDQVKLVNVVQFS